MVGDFIAPIVAPDGAVRTAKRGSTNMFGNAFVVDTIGTTNRGARCATAHTVCVMETIGLAVRTESTMRNGRAYVFIMLSILKVANTAINANTCIHQDHEEHVPI